MKVKKEISTVAIVGRPNVGKSTLFNKIIGHRKAIVNNTLGLTRDRNYNMASFRERDFLLIDTGGFEPASDNDIFMLVKEQAKLAIEESDVIIFLCDGKAGLTGEDIEVFNQIRKTGKPTIVSVNKIDDPKHSDRIYEFYKLGCKNLMSISAEHSIGISDLLEKVCHFLPDAAITADEGEKIKLSVVGRPNVGKSSLVNKILNENRVLVDDRPGTTRDTIDTYFKRGDSEFLLIDTAGIRKKGRVSDVIEKYSIIMAKRAIENSDIALILIDAIEGITAQDTKIAGYAYEAGRACIIVVNKWDMIEKNSTKKESFTEEIRNNLKYLSFSPVFFISAKTGEGISRLLSSVEEVYQEYYKKVRTSELNSILQKAWERRPPSLYKGKAVKFYYSTQVKSAPPTFLIFVNYPQEIHFSYKRYIENRLRDEFVFIGTPLITVFKERR